MPASLPGVTATVSGTGNPSAGTPVIFDLISGPKGSPRDNDKDYPYGGTWQIAPPAPAPAPTANGAASTGALSTGIGFGLNIGPQGVKDIQVTNGSTQNFTDNYIPGVSKPDATSSADSTLMYIGGGKSDAAGKTTTDPAGLARNVPYTAGFGIGAAGGGGSRDAGAGPAYTGFTMKMVTAAADVAAAGVIETGFTNRSGLTIPLGQNQFGSTGTVTAAPSMTKAEEEEAERNAKAAKPAPKKEEKDPEKLKLAKDLDEAAKKEEARIEEEERVKRERAEGAKLPPIGAHVHIKETPDGLDTKPKVVPPKKDK